MRSIVNLRTTAQPPLFVATSHGFDPEVSQPQVKILNAPHGRGFTSLKKADKMVRRGTARWEGNCLRLIETDYRFNSEALPSKTLTHEPNLPQPVPVDWLSWRTNEASVAWPWVESPSATA